MTSINNLYDAITGDEDARVCRDIPDAACNDQPRNFFVHILALVATKSGDLLASPKLVLPWLLASLGAPAYITGMLVPVRESLALLPQLAVAARMRAVAIRKWFWIGGSLVQGLCILAMAALAFVGIDGAAGGWSVLGLLAIFSLGRGVCSVAAKDVMGKTVSKTRRGTVSGYAASIAGLVAIAMGAVLFFGAAPSGSGVIGLLVFAGVLWLLAACVFCAVQEQPGATSGGGNAASEAMRSLQLLRNDRDLRNFIITRTLLISTALVAPFYVLLAQQHGDSKFGIGLLLLASGIASAGSGGVWGRLADQSSRRVLAAGGILGALVSVLTASLHLLPFADSQLPYAYAGVYLLLGVAHSGVRLGRKTYLVDLANADNRSAYVALSNTVIGVLLLAGGLIISLLSLIIATPSIVYVLAAGALAGGLYALRLPEVQA